MIESQITINKCFWLFAETENYGFIAISSCVSYLLALMDIVKTVLLIP